MAGPLTLVFTAPGRVDLVPAEGALTTPPGSALVRTLVSALSAGTELLAFRGQIAPGTVLDETLASLGSGTFQYPFRYGYAAVGDVTAVGTGVDPTWVGRRVFAFEPHATAFVAPVADLVPVPEGLAPERAALLAHMETAVNLVLDGAPLLGEQTLVIGQGTVGLLVSALLARFPLSSLTVCEPLPHRAAAARTLGAPQALPADQVVGALGERGADLVYELSGNPVALELAIAAAGHEGRIVVGSWYGSKRASVDLGGRFHRRRLRLISSQVTHIAPALSARWNKQRRFDLAWTALQEIDTRSLISHRVPFAEAQAAYELIDRQADQVLQVLLEYP
ncbi:MAG TPA: zinc-binding alcohol dehydrogenase [Polyangia bacterium]|nr:zinc-binding alcohol dehydrogenase [Polyangia bacterium]